MVYIRRKEQENISAFVRRFIQRVQASNVLKEVKTKKRYSKPISKNVRRGTALEREKMRQYYRTQRKLGRTE